MRTLEKLSNGLSINLISIKRGAKPKVYSQENHILATLKNGGTFTELQLGKIIYGESKRGARSSISILRKEGYQIATKPVYNYNTGRYNVGYYIENDSGKYIAYCRRNGEFNFNPGPK